MFQVVEREYLSLVDEITMTSRLLKIWQCIRSECAATAVEYAVMLSIIVAAAATITVLGTSTDDNFEEANQAFNGESGNGGETGDGGSSGDTGGSGGSGGGGFCS